MKRVILTIGVIVSLISCTKKNEQLLVSQGSQCDNASKVVRLDGCVLGVIINGNYHSVSNWVDYPNTSIQEGDSIHFSYSSTLPDFNPTCMNDNYVRLDCLEKIEEEIDTNSCNEASRVLRLDGCELGVSINGMYHTVSNWADYSSTPIQEGDSIHFGYSSTLPDFNPTCMNDDYVRLTCLEKIEEVNDTSSCNEASRVLRLDGCELGVSINGVYHTVSNWVDYSSTLIQEGDSIHFGYSSTLPDFNPTCMNDDYVRLICLERI